MKPKRNKRHNTLGDQLLSDDQSIAKQQSSWSMPQFIHWAWHSMVWNIPLASLGQLSWPCSPPDSHVSPTGRA